MELAVQFSVGELAKICGVTPKTLRFYDQLGLLKPAMVNPQNGYRFYNRWHITRLTTIKQLQEIGISLNDIQCLFAQDDTANMIDQLSNMLEAQRKLIELQLDALNSKRKSVQLLQLQCAALQDNVTYDDKSGFILRELPRRDILYLSYQGKPTPDLFRASYQKMISEINQITPKGTASPLISSPLAIYDTPSNSDDGTIKIGFEVNTLEPLPFSRMQLEHAAFACYTVRGSYSELRSTVFQNVLNELIGMGYRILSPQIEFYRSEEVV